MRIWATLKTLSTLQLFKLAQLFVTRPHYIVLTLNASKKAMQISTEIYGETHHKSNKANAFRHSLWTVLLGRAVFQKTSDLKKAKDWALKFTNLHEELFVNKELDRVMDLHNNTFGIEKLDKLVKTTEGSAVNFLKMEAENAIQITNPQDVKPHLKQLVYISEA